MFCKTAIGGCPKFNQLHTSLHAAYLHSKTLQNYNDVHQLFRHLFTHHITLLGEDAILSALWGHPPHGQFHVGVTLLPAVVVSSVDVLSQAKISHFDNSIGINPKS